MHPHWLFDKHFETASYPDSWWAASAPTPVQPAPELNEELSAETVIIGAGYTGLNAALRLAGTHGMDTVVLEAGQPGWGGSGRNGGFCSPGGAHMEYTDMIRRWGLETTREFCNTQQAAIAHVGELGESLGIDFDRAGHGEYILGTGPRAALAAREEASWLKDTLGLGARALDEAALHEAGMAGPHFQAAVHLPNGFGLHPLKYTLGLARAATGAGARIYGHSAVTGWREERGEHVLTTAGGRVRARRVLLATNGYTSTDIGGPLAGRLLPVFSNILVTRPLSQAELQAQGWLTTELAADDRKLLHYFRLLPDGRFMFGGRGGIGGAPAEEGQVRKRLEAEFRTLFPAWREVGFDYFWSGLVCLCRDKTFHAGAIPGRRNAWYGLAYHGGGVSMASWTGTALADLIAGKHDSQFRIPAPMSTPLPWMPFPPLRPLYLRGAYAWFALVEALKGQRLKVDYQA